MTDEQVMQLAMEGDLDKIAILFERYKVKLYNFFYKLHHDRDLSQDLTQNVFMRVVRYRNSYNPNFSFKSWMYQIARNVNTDHFRKQKVHFSDFTDIQNLEDQMPETWEDLKQEDDEKILTKAMTLLSDEDREILVLNRFQNLTYEAIAEIMQSTQGAIKVKAHRAIKKLRKLYFEISIDN